MKKAMVIGASSGIGKSLAKLLAANGYKVVITGRRKDLLEKLKKEIQGSFIVKQFDVTDTDKTETALEESVSELGGLDLLFLSSGTGNINEDLSFTIEKDTINVNVTGFTAVSDWAFNYFQKQGYGHFAAITSVAGLRGEPAAPAYNATKSYQMNYLEALRKKATKTNKNIFITDIRPGFVDTDMAKGEGLFWVAPVEKSAKQIFKALETNIFTAESVAGLYL